MVILAGQARKAATVFGTLTRVSGRRESVGPLSLRPRIAAAPVQ